MIEHFDECWIPDFAGEKNLAGKLSHRVSNPANVIFIGPLSRFSWEKTIIERNVLIVISGPENQRTKLEEQLTAQSIKSEWNILMVRGIPEGNRVEQLTPNFSKVDHLNAEQLNHAFLSSEIIITQSGYSTIMDLATTHSRAILIPTPGQTEQEYLAMKLKKEKIFYSQSQKKFNLGEALDEAKKYAFINLQQENTSLQWQIDDLIEMIENREFMSV